MKLLQKIKSKNYTLEALAKRWKMRKEGLVLILKDIEPYPWIIDAINGLPHYHNQTIYYRTSNFNYILIGAENGIGHHATVVMQGCFATNLLELARQSAFIVEEDVF